jgi:hypothetical protein
VVEDEVVTTFGVELDTGSVEIELLDELDAEDEDLTTASVVLLIVSSGVMT